MPPTPRLAEFWSALKAQVDTPTVQAVLGGAGRVYFGWEAHDEPEGPDTAPWGRIILAVGETLWPQPDIGAYLRAVRFRVVVEMNDFEPVPPATYNVLTALEAVQAECYDRLQWWTPTGFARMKVGLAVAREELPSAQPLWDEDRHLWWSSSLYRFEAAAAA